MQRDENPILNNPYEEPSWHYATNLQGELDYSRPVKGRRVFTPEVQTIPVRQGAQGDLMELNEVAAAEHSSHIVNLLCREVTAWRGAKYAAQSSSSGRESAQTSLSEDQSRLTSAATMVENKTYLHIGPKFGTVSKQALTEDIKACRDKRDGDWLLIMGFAFESGITELSRSFGNFQVSIVRMHDDLLQLGLLKKDKKAASFVTIGEPDIKLHIEPGSSGRESAPSSGKKKDQSRHTSAATAETMATVEIAGLDIYDPIKDEVKSRDVHDIAYWMLDDAYDGSNFVVRQVFFCGGDKDEFDEWIRDLSDLAKAKTKRAAEQTLKVELNGEAFSRIYGHKSHPFPVKKGQKSPSASSANLVKRRRRCWR